MKIQQYLIILNTHLGMNKNKLLTAQVHKVIHNKTAAPIFLNLHLGEQRDTDLDMIQSSIPIKIQEMKII